MKNFEEDLFQLKLRIVTDKQFATDVYNALCNMRWKEIENPGNIYSCSWRYAGGLVADIRGNSERMSYMDFYHSGFEGIVTKKVENIFNRLGWISHPYIGETR